MAAPVGAYTRAAERRIYVDGLQGCCEAPLMQSQEGQRALEERQASQTVG